MIKKDYERNGEEKMGQQKRVLNYLTVIGFGLVGQLGCWGLMIGGQAFTTIGNALIIHAMGAPIIFGLISYIYFRKFNYTSPRLTASIFLAVVASMDFFIVALLIERSFEMFFSPIGTWIPFTLIFTSTYLTGQNQNVRKGQSVTPSSSSMNKTRSTLMKAVVYEKYGPPSEALEYKNVEKPTT